MCVYVFFANPWIILSLQLTWVKKNVILMQGGTFNRQKHFFLFTAKTRFYFILLIARQNWFSSLYNIQRYNTDGEKPKMLYWSWLVDGRKVVLHWIYQFPIFRAGYHILILFLSAALKLSRSENVDDSFTVTDSVQHFSKDLYKVSWICTLIAFYLCLYLIVVLVLI